MNPAVARHRTAMSRGSLSRPLTVALADSILTTSQTVFDYGCGRGDDLRHLGALGIEATGWDPTHRPHEERREANVVNIGYVVNVIEDPVERAATLRSAWALAQSVLVVSARLIWDARDLVSRPHSDGVMTRTGTFQKFYEQPELARWIEKVLGVQPFAAAPGIFYLFRDPVMVHQFLASRVRVYQPRVRIDPHALYEAHREDLAPLLNFMTTHARPPKPHELDGDIESAVRGVIGSLGRATQLIRQVTVDTDWDEIRIQRRNELLIYIAMSRFGRRPRFSQLPATLASDIKALFGTYQLACIQADRLLLACGDPAIILVSARSSKVGKQTPSALYVHRSAVGELPPVLQVYEACARVLTGTIAQANLIKLSVQQPQVSYVSYPLFDRDAHPALASAITVNLKRLSIDWRDYRTSDNPPVLHRKEEFLGVDDPKRPLYERLTRAEVRAGLYERPEVIGNRKGWRATLASAGVSIRGHRLVRQAATSR